MAMVLPHLSCHNNLTHTINPNSTSRCSTITNPRYNRIIRVNTNHSLTPRI